MKFEIHHVWTVCAAFAAILATSSIATAQTRLTLEQAWNQCLKEVTSSTTGISAPESDAARTAAFKACMTRIGHAEGK